MGGVDWGDCVVPFAMEIRVLNVEAPHLLVRHDDPLGKGFVVEFASNRQAGFGGGGADRRCQVN
jgi:hypothetical protein